MFISIIICTRNRATEVVNCLPRVAEQARAFEDVEVIVVDNGSTDNTRTAVEQSAGELAYPFRYVYEPVAGLCQARNRGRAEARGRVLAYIDDDVNIENDWVANLRAHFLDGGSDCLAGKIGSKLNGKLPFPMDDTMRWFFCETNFGEEPRWLKSPEHPIGGNMGFTTDVFDSIGGFDTNLKLYGDESNFFRRASEAGFSMFYDPRILANQVIPASRLTLEELRKKSYVWGNGAATGWMLSGPTMPQRAAKIIEYALRSFYIGIRSTGSNSFGKFYTFWYSRGYLSQLIKGLEQK